MQSITLQKWTTSLLFTLSLAALGAAVAFMFVGGQFVKARDDAGLIQEGDLLVRLHDFMVVYGPAVVGVAAAATVASLALLIVARLRLRQRDA